MLKIFNFGTNKEGNIRGFTLIELLLAISIFAIVVSAVYGSYNVTFRVINSAGKSMDSAKKAHTVLDLITDDFSSLVQGENGFLSGEQHEDNGIRGDSVSFVSAAHIGLTKEDARSGYSSVQYITEVDEDTGLLQLYRSGLSLLPGQKEEQGEAGRYLLCAGLKEFRLTYFDADGVERDEWRSREEQSDDKEQTFPLMVKVVLQFAETVESEKVSVFTTSVALPQNDGWI